MMHVSPRGRALIKQFEGFREHVPGFIPDLGVGGGVRSITGTSELKLTVASFDTQLSKPIPIAGTVTLHPHIGYQILWIFGDSGLIDLKALALKADAPKTSAAPAAASILDAAPLLGTPLIDVPPTQAPEGEAKTSRSRITLAMPQALRPAMPGDRETPRRTYP